MPHISRRNFLRGLGILTLSAAMPLRFAHAATPGDKRLFVVVLRGAMDGLAAVVPYGDPAYADARGAMRMPQNADALLNLDGYFALNAALAPLMPLYQQKELAILHATATPYRDRSHFDAQDLLENGTDKPHTTNTGWLNRAAAVMQNPRSALALGPAIPLLLRGEAKVTSWAPSTLAEVNEDFLTRVMHMYQNDPLLINAISQAQMMKGADGGGGGGGAKAFTEMMKKAAEFMVAADGLHIGTIDLGGWDTHANQGLQNGRLVNNLKLLADGLIAYRTGMGSAWKDTAVLVLTEFGRTVKGNGTNGTDHGTGSAAFLLGGSVNGGRMLGDWPGMAKLYQDRDLMPINDMHGLLKGTLAKHLAISDTQLSSKVFPNSIGVPSMSNLFRS